MQARANTTHTATGPAIGVPSPVVELDTAADVLAHARSQHAAAQKAQAELIRCAVAWAELHPAESIPETPAVWPVTGLDSEVTLAGQGAPGVAEFSIAEFGAALGISTAAARARMGYGLEIKYRLPHLQARLDLAGQPGGIEPWRATRIAEHTLTLTPQAAAYVDAQVAPVAHRVGLTTMERLVEEAIARFMPEQAIADAKAAADRRHLNLHLDRVTFEGTSYLDGEIDLGDGYDLDTAISQIAAQLAADGSEETLDVRRSMALGILARRHLDHDLNQDPDKTGADSEPGQKRVKPRQVILYVHLSEEAIRSHLTGTNGAFHLARVENHHQGLSADQVRTWCANPDTVVIIKPVIDLNDHIATDAYEVPDRLREQAVLRDHTCVFPWCTRTARRCDLDHIEAYAEGGATSSENIAPLCRGHHRLKTHSPWTYTVLEPGTYLWTSPHGYHYLRDHTGTRDVTRKRDAPDG